MKWIAKRNFYRVPALKDVKLGEYAEGAIKSKNPLDIPQGAFFELGDAKDEADLQLGNDPKKLLIAQLRYAGCIGDAADKKVVETVVAKIAERNKREAAAEKLAKTQDGSAILAAFEALLAKAGGGKQTA